MSKNDGHKKNGLRFIIGNREDKKNTKTSNTIDEMKVSYG